MKKIKLLYIVEAFGGGVFTYIVDLTNRLSEKYDITIAYGLRTQTPANFKDYFNPNIKLIEVKSFKRSINPLNDLNAFFEIRRIAKNFNPKVIHLHSSKAGVLGRFAFNGKKVKLFYTPHGYSFLMENTSKLKRSIYKMIEKISSLRPCTTISCSKGEHKETLALTKKAVYVNNGVNVEDMDRIISGINSSDPNNKVSVFTLGRICYQKNPKLFNAIAKKFPQIQFIWIGDGELKNELTSPNIKITGWLNREEALKIAFESSIFMLTSLWEGLPISLLEAMYQKKLCIVSNVIGNKDVIRNGYNGFLCKDENDFFNAINEAVSDNLSELRENAKKDILNKYNTKVMAEKYDKIYREVF